MDVGFWVLLALAGVVFVFLGPVGFFLTIGARERLQIAERKILALEAQLRVAQVLPAAAPATQTAEAASAVPEQAEESMLEGESEVARANDSIGVAESPASRERQTEPGEPPPLLAQPPRRSLEEALGAHWAVYVGGVALALGGLLLVRYSIEQGWFGPGARVALGLLFALTLVPPARFCGAARKRQKLWRMRPESHLVQPSLPLCSPQQVRSRDSAPSTPPTRSTISLGRPSPSLRSERPA